MRAVTVENVAEAIAGLRPERREEILALVHAYQGLHSGEPSPQEREARSFLNQYPYSGSVMDRLHARGKSHDPIEFMRELLPFLEAEAKEIKQLRAKVERFEQLQRNVRWFLGLES